MSQASSGKDQRLYIWNGSASTFNLLGQERETSVDFETDRADATNKDSNNWSEGIPTIRSMAIESSGVTNESDTALNDLLDHYFNHTKPKARIITPGGVTFTSTCTLDSLSYDGPHDDIMSFSLSLSSDGTVTKG